MSKPVTREAEKAYTVAQAADMKGVSKKTILRAIHATKGNTLVARKPGLGKGRGSYLILASDLDRWFLGLEPVA